MSAMYKVISRFTKDAKPILYVRLRVEYNLVVDDAGIEHLETLVQRFTDTEDKFLDHEHTLWLDALGGMKRIVNELRDRPSSELIRMESRWSVLPHRHANAIATEYAVSDSDLYVNITGSAPNTNINFTFGGASVEIPCPWSAVRKTKEDLERLCNAAKKYLDDNPNASLDDSSKVLASVKDVGFTTQSIIDFSEKVMRLLPMATYGTWFGLGFAALQAVLGVYGIIEAQEQQQELERFKREVEAVCHGGSEYAGIDPEGTRRAGTYA